MFATFQQAKNIVPIFPGILSGWMGIVKNTTLEIYMDARNKEEEIIDVIEIEDEPEFVDIIDEEQEEESEIKPEVEVRPHRDLRESEEDEELAIRSKDQSHQSYLQSWNTEHARALDKLDSVQTRIELAKKEQDAAFEDRDPENYRVYTNIIKRYEAEEQQLQAEIAQSVENWNIVNAMMPHERDQDLVDKKIKKLLIDRFKEETGRSLTQTELDQLIEYEQKLVNENYAKNDPRKSSHWNHMYSVAIENFAPKGETKMPEKSVRKGPPTGGSSQSRSSSKSEPFKLTPAHRDALDRMGIDDPRSPEAQKYIRAWKNYKPSAWSVQVGEAT